jgi:branched-chain amino acid transport system ATP-binding protein
VLLETTCLTKTFGGLHAVEGVTLSVEPGKVTSLIGPNGAGKTTFFNCISGVLPPTSGTVLFRGQPIGHLKPHQIARLGIARTFQNIRLFSEMTVLENVMVGRYTKSALPTAKALFQAILHGASFRSAETVLKQEAMALLDFLGLAPQQAASAGALSYGDQRRLEIARALATDPVLLLLDEPAAGMNPKETEGLMQLVGRIKERGVTPFLIEHNMRMVMGISDHIIVLDHGVKLAEGEAGAIQQNHQVIEAYLGRPAA